MNPNYTPTWPQAEIETLRREHAAGASFSEIAAMLPGRTRGSVAAVVSRMGLSNAARPHPDWFKPSGEKSPWSDAELARLRRLWDQGVSVEAIATQMERSRQSVRGKARVMGLPLRRVAVQPTGDTTWSDPTKVEKLKELWATGITAAEVAAAIGVSRASVASKAKRMGLKRNRAIALKAPVFKAGNRRPPQPGPQARPAVVFGDIKVSSPQPAYVPKVSNVESPNARPFLEVRKGQCRWPIGEGLAMLSCCNPVARGSYCEGHAAIGYNGAAPKVANGTSIFAPSVIEMRAVHFTRHERIDQVELSGKGTTRKKPRTIWDDAREARAA